MEHTWKFMHVWGIRLMVSLRSSKSCFMLNSGELAVFANGFSQAKCYRGTSYGIPSGLANFFPILGK